MTGLASRYHVLDGPLSGKLKSAGRAMPGIDLVIMDGNNQVLTADEVGEICVRGPNVMLGYYNLSEQTAATIQTGWLHTGDSGYLDAEGFLFILDRVKDMIISGGENIYSIEVENAIYQHPAVEQCAVIGIPSEKWGEQVHAIVMLEKGKTLAEAELIEHCRTLISAFKCPRSITFQQEPLPISGAGKILKADLRKTLCENNS
nr:AMP-binding protein [Oceanicoccus sp. KOV_DT_Chl]